MASRLSKHLEPLDRGDLAPVDDLDGVTGFCSLLAVVILWVNFCFVFLLVVKNGLG